MSKIKSILVLLVLTCSCQQAEILLKAYQNEGKDFEISIPEQWEVRVAEEEIIAKQGGMEDFFNELKVTTTYKSNWGTFEPVEEEILLKSSELGSLKYQNNLQKVETDTYIMYSYDLKGPGPMGGTVTFRKYEINIKDKPEDYCMIIAESFKEFNSEEELFMKAILASLKFL